MPNPTLDAVLRSLRSQIRRYVVWDSLLAIAAVLLVAFWIGFLLDYGPVTIGGSEMPSTARGVLLALTVAGSLTLVGRSLIGRLVRKLPDKSLALLIEKHHPGVAGRLSTAVELSRPGRIGDSHSPAMLAKVTTQAAEAMKTVQPDRVLDGSPLRRKSMLVAPLAIAMLVLGVLAPSTMARAASRLTLFSNEPWPRRASLEMVGIELPQTRWTGQDEATVSTIKFDDDKSAKLPIGSSGVLRIRANAKGAEVPQVCTVYYRMVDGSRGQTSLRRVGRIQDGFQSFVLDGSPLASLNQSVWFSIHGLDDALRDYQITAVAPPTIDQTNVATQYPQYLRTVWSDDDDEQRSYQSGMRIREGSRVRVSAEVAQPVGQIRARLTSGDEVREIDADIGPDGLSATLDIEPFRSATTIELIPVDPSGISAQAPYRYFLGIVDDQPPEVSLRLAGIGAAITPMANLPMTLSATDDYAIKDASVSAIIELPDSQASKATPPQNDPNAEPGGETSEDGNSGNDEQLTAPEPASHTVRPRLDREGTADFSMDLRELELSDQLPTPAIGSTISLIAEAVDRYDIDTPHTPRCEPIRLTVVTPDKLLSLLERTELELRSRLEQTTSEVRLLRDTLDAIRLDIGEIESDDAVQTDRDDSRASDSDNDNQRAEQIIRLRVQQSGLQVGKTRDELIGVVQTLQDLVAEMVNNRVDTPDRQDRLINQVATPLQGIVDGPLAQLGQQVTAIESSLAQPTQSAKNAADAIQSADSVIAALDAVLEKMLDLESFNELLDLVRGLIDDQEQLLDDTKIQRKQKVLDLFQ